MRLSKAKQCEHKQGAPTEVLGSDDFQKDRRVYLFQEIDESVAQAIVYQLLVLNDDNRELPIDLLINCPGGDADACEAILAAIHMIQASVNAICMGRAYSAGFSVLVCATGLRVAYEYSSLMMHQPSGGFIGDSVDTRIHAQSLERIWDNIIERFHVRTGQPAEVLKSQMSRDYFLTAKEAEERGFIDGIIRHDHRPRVVIHKYKHPTEDPDESASGDSQTKKKPKKKCCGRGKKNSAEGQASCSPSEPQQPGI